MLGKRSAILSLLALGGGVAGAVAAPETPAAAKTWQLEVKFRDPERLSVVLPGDSTATTFWYMVYEVTNRTGQDVGFYPSFELVTDTMKVVEGGAEIPPRLYEIIKARHRQDFPFLASPYEATGPLLQGEANRRASVAVFREFDPEADGFTIYVSGLSGDIQRIPNPAFNPKAEESAGNRRAFLLRRTLAIEYDLPGDPTTRDSVEPIRKTRRWVMR